MEISELVILKKEDLEKILPHRDAALMIDEIVIEVGGMKGTKFISADDKNLEGHFPENPIYPGHCLDEMQCLVAATLVKMMFPNINGLPVVVSKNGVRYKKAVFPGDLLSISVSLLENKFIRLFEFKTTIHNQDGELVAEIESMKGIAMKSSKGD